MRVTVRREHWNLRSPLITAHGPIDTRSSLVVAVEQHGFVGEGEAAPLPGFGLESFDEADSQLQRWSQGGSPPDSPAATAAVHSAVAQLTAAARGETLDATLTGQPAAAGPLLVQALVGDDAPEAIGKRVEAAAVDGFRAVKLKVGALPVANDIERILIAAAVTQRHGIALRLDANQGWAIDDARRVLSAVADLAIDVVEEPTSRAAEWDELAAIGVPLALDEQLATLDAAESAFRIDAVAALVLKPAVLGGPVSTFHLARRAIGAGKRVIVSSFIDGPVGLRVARDLALAVDPQGVHGVGTAPLFLNPMPRDVTPVNGALHRS